MEVFSNRPGDILYEVLATLPKYPRSVPMRTLLVDFKIKQGSAEKLFVSIHEKFGVSIKRRNGMVSVKPESWLQACHVSRTYWDRMEAEDTAA